MQDELITYKTVKLALKKGIDFRSKEFSSIVNRSKAGVYHAYITQSLLQRWLREVHDVVVESIIFNKGFLEENKFCYQYRIYNKSDNWITGLEYKTYELALEDALYNALNLIK